MKKNNDYTSLIITSAQNDKIKSVVQLHARKGRTYQKRFIVEGMRALEAMITAGHKPRELYVRYEHEQDVQTLAPQARVTIVSDTVMQKISTAKTASGILGVFAIPALPDPSNIGPGVVLAHIADPGNMGTLIRTATALNKKTVVIVEGADPWSPKVVQSSAGTIGTVDIYQLSWERLMELKGNTDLCALVVADGTHPCNVDLSNCLLVIGSEAHGLPTEWQRDCDTLLTLPMPGKTESLNAAVAGSIALYLSVETK